jgi:hypothetical protein
MSQQEPMDAWVTSEIESVIKAIEEADFEALGVPMTLRVASVHPAPDGSTTKSVVFRLALRRKPEGSSDSTHYVETPAAAPHLDEARLTTQFDLKNNITKQISMLIATATQLAEAQANNDPARRVLTYTTGLSPVAVAAFFVASALLAGGLSGLLYLVWPEGRVWKFFAYLGLFLFVVVLPYCFGAKSRTLREARTPNRPRAHERRP